MKKILIMVMSCQNEFFINQEKYVKDTWAKDIINGKYENVSFVIYRGGYNENSYSKKENLLALHVEDDINSTFKKTYFAFSMAEKIFGEYDYIFRTNTSTYVNVELLNEFIQHIDNDEFIYSGDIYSLSENNAPYPLSLTIRGNALILSRKNIDLILKEGLPFLYVSGTDDYIMSNIINSYHIKNKEDYKKYIKSFCHGWYKCIDKTDFNTGNRLCGYGNNSQDYEFWKDFISIQIRNYGDLTSFKFRENESEKFYELQKIFDNGKPNKELDKSLKKNIDRSNDYDVFIGSILGYLKLEEWNKVSKEYLYKYEAEHKASDDLPGQAQKTKSFIYVDYYYNNSNNILI